MVKVVGIRFKPVGKIYFFDPSGIDFEEGDYAVLDTARGVECGYVAQKNHEVMPCQVIEPLRKVIRKATDEDKKRLEANRRREDEAYKICADKITEHKLDMNLVDVECAFDGSNLLFYFTADGRVDFRELVKDLAGVFRTRIELRQIGVRDEAKMIGGVGICGRTLCCHGYLDTFDTVSIKMAKEQGLSLNPTKISGSCGRLMCCLKYEQEAYEDLTRSMPKVGALVEIPGGSKGTVEKIALLRRIVTVRIDGNNTSDLKDFPADEIKVLRNGKARSETDSDVNEDDLKNLE
ncbi:MAG: stage 0 sporulation family protein [Clostridia bacterium]|nr:stage 0 sporulation family protein [Clostridia bacterium]